MLVASTCLVVFVLTVWIRSVGHKQPLDRVDVHRLRRFSEKLQRENSLPFD
jgi:hypothetical protein